MAFSLNLRVDNASAGAITALWDEVSAFEDMTSMRALNYAPHFTFAIYDAGVADELARSTIERAASGEAELRITFNRIRTFTGPPLILGLIQDHRNLSLECTRLFTRPSIQCCVGPTTDRHPGYRIVPWERAFARSGATMPWPLRRDSVGRSRSYSTSSTALRSHRCGLQRRNASLG